MSETAPVAPEVTVRGPGEPVAAVIGGTHGDEPSGVRAVEYLREADLEFRQAVKLIVANPPAVRAGKRYLDTDLNRAFPGDPTGNREQRLASRLCEEIAGLSVLSLHATHSQPEPMALVDGRRADAVDLAARLPVASVIDHSPVVEGSLTACGTVVTIEAGCQHSDAAAETATEQAVAFLQVLGVLAGEPEFEPVAKSFYRLEAAVPKPAGEPELLVENFREVPAGSVYARAGDTELVAETPFYPVLMSECGYEDVFGYRASRLGDSPEDLVVTD